jgi:hypothetical protein
MTAGDQTKGPDYFPLDFLFSGGVKPTPKVALSSFPPVDFLHFLMPCYFYPSPHPCLTSASLSLLYSCPFTGLLLKYSYSRKCTQPFTLPCGAHVHTCAPTPSFLTNKRTN